MSSETTAGSVAPTSSTFTPLLPSSSSPPPLSFQQMEPSGDVEKPISEMNVKPTSPPQTQDTLTSETSPETQVSPKIKHPVQFDTQPVSTPDRPATNPSPSIEEHTPNPATPSHAHPATSSARQKSAPKTAPRTAGTDISRRVPVPDFDAPVRIVFH